MAHLPTEQINGVGSQVSGGEGESFELETCF